MNVNAPLIDSYPPMMFALVVFIFGVMTVLSVIQFVVYLKGWRSIGYILEQWSITNDWFAGALLLVVGVFLAHFLLNPLPCPRAGTPLADMSPRCVEEAKHQSPPASPSQVTQFYGP